MIPGPVHDRGDVRGAGAARHGGRVEASPELELMAPVDLNIVCFRLRGADPDRLSFTRALRVARRTAASHPGFSP